jgi:ketosteroid isomerase-like protein
MAEESTTRDPIERMREIWEGASRGDFDLQRIVDDYSPDAVFDTGGYGMGTFAGQDAIRGWLGDWISSFEALTMTAEQIVDLGNGVAMVVYHQRGRPIGGTNYVRVRSAMVLVWAHGMIVRATIYPEIDEARTAAERLAKEPG